MFSLISILDVYVLLQDVLHEICTAYQEEKSEVIGKKAQAVEMGGFDGKLKQLKWEVLMVVSCPCNLFMFSLLARICSYSCSSPVGTCMIRLHHISS